MVEISGNYYWKLWIQSWTLNCRRLRSGKDIGVMECVFEMEGSLGWSAIPRRSDVTKTLRWTVRVVDILENLSVVWKRVITLRWVKFWSLQKSCVKLFVTDLFCDTRIYQRYVIAMLINCEFGAIIDLNYCFGVATSYLIVQFADANYKWRKVCAYLQTGSS